jgi:hypothetical protein
MGTSKRRNPHGVAPETLKTVLLLVDVINDFDFPQTENSCASLCPPTVVLPR